MSGVDMNEAQQAAQVAGTAVSAGKVASITAAKYTLLALFIAAVSCVAVIMAATAPNGKRNLFLCIVSTAMASICLGCYVAVKYGFATDIALAVLSGDIQALVAAVITLIGVAFICGLPAWCLIGGLFVWFERMKGKTIVEILADAKTLWN